MIQAARFKGVNEENKMDRDREKICEIISDMLDAPDESGIYPTSTAYTRLEHYCEQIRYELSVGAMPIIASD